MRFPLSRSVAIVGCLSLLFALVLARMPLFHLLGYEFSAAISLAISILLPAVLLPRAKRSDLPFGAQWRDALWVGWGLLLIPLAVILANGLFVRNCDPLEGIALYLLLPVVTVPYVISIALFWAAILPSRALLGCYLHLLASILLAAHNLIFHPPVFLYQSLIGFFPGPIYDERIRITTLLLLARGITLLFAGLFAGIAGVLWSSRNDLVSVRSIPRRLFRWFSTGWNTRDGVARRLFLLLALLASLLVLVRQDDWGFRPTRQSIQRALGGRYETEHFVIYYDALSRTADKIGRLARDHEFRYAQLVRFFGFETRQKIGSYIYADADQKKRLMGARYTGIEDPIGREIHLEDRGFPHPMLKHEVAHVFASYLRPVFRASLKIGLNEGIAVAAEWEDGPLTVHQWCRGMQELGLAPELKHIMGAWGFWSEQGARSYTVAGSFVRFLVDRYGMERFAKVFPTGNFQDAYERSLDELEAEWRDFLRTVPLDDRDRALVEYRYRRPALFQRPCAHEIAERSEVAWQNYSVGETRRAVTIFRQLAAWDPTNPDHLRGQMLALFRQGDWADAQAIAQQILEHPGTSARLAGEARRRLGDMAWLAGKVSEAEASYRQVLDAHLSEAEDREMFVKLYALRSHNADRFRDALLRQTPEGIRLSEGAQVVRLMLGEEDPVALYLLGRRLFYGGDYPQAVTYFQRQLELSVGGLFQSAGAPSDPSPLYAETYRLLGRAYYELAQYDKAIHAFQRWSQSTSARGTQQSAHDWIERCTWEQE